jgi:ABC-type glycerol-3-phosphate transport system substrate-binding protein
MTMGRQAWLLLLVGLLLWGGCSASGGGQRNTNGGQKMSETTSTPTPAQSPRPYSKDLDELRAAFNRDKGRVRLVTLLSPT